MSATLAGATSTDRVVDGLDVTAYTVPTETPEADGTLEWTATTMVLAEVRSGPVTGIGWTYGPPATAVAAHDLADLVVGARALDVTGTSRRMLRSVRNGGPTGLATYAVSAVDVALWDLKARLLDLPLHALLGAVRDDVAVYGSGGFTTYDSDQLGRQLRGWTDQGIGRVKIKIGESWGSRVDRDLDRMAEARAVIGPDVELFVDANGGYGRKQAVRVMAEASELDVRWFEEPVSSDDLEGLRMVRDAVRPDVAAGEYGGNIGYFRRMCAAGAVDCLQVDATRCGGISEWLRAAAVAAAFGLDVSAHCAPHVHVHVAAATPNFRHLEWFHDHARIEQMFFEGALDPGGGVLRPDRSAAGHGLRLRRDVADRYRR